MGRPPRSDLLIRGVRVFVLEAPCPMAALVAFTAMPQIEEPTVVQQRSKHSIHSLFNTTTTRGLYISIAVTPTSCYDYLDHRAVSLDARSAVPYVQETDPGRKLRFNKHTTTISKTPQL